MSPERKPLQLLMVTHYFAAHGGGIERVADAIASGLAAPDLVVTWVASDCDLAPQASPHRAHVQMSTWNGLERRFGLPYPIWGLRSYLRLWQEVKHSDVIHLHDYLYAGNLFACACAWIHQKPVVLTQHVGFIPYRAAALRWTLSFLNRTIGTLMLRSANRVIFVSRVVEAYFHEFVSFPNPPRLVANGLDLSLFNPHHRFSRGATLARLGFCADRRTLLFVGRFVERKGLDIVLSLVERHPEFQWIIVGDGPISPDESEHKNMIVLRRQSQQALAQIYAAADLLVLPSVGEGFPLVIQESLACGTPVLTSNETRAAFEGPPGFIYSSAIATPDVALAWSKALVEILQSKVFESGEVRLLAESYARATWSWDRCCWDYRLVYQSVHSGDKK